MHKKILTILFFVVFAVPQTAWFGGASPALADFIVDTAWVRRYDADGWNSDHAYDIAVDELGNAYVTGFSHGGLETHNDYTTIKYYPNGDTAWVRRYDGPGNASDEAHVIAVDGSGNVHVTGASEESVFRYATIKYYPSGDTAWVRTYTEPIDLNSAWAIAVDNSGYVYVTGQSGDIYGGCYPWCVDYATVKYSPSGDELWVRRYRGPVESLDGASAIAVDGSSNVYVTGFTMVGGTGYDYATIKYNASGTELWVRRYDSNDFDVAYAIAIDGSNNVYVTGTSGTIKYSTGGSLLWDKPWGGFDIALDASNNAYVTGYSEEVPRDYQTVKYYSNGDTAWVRTYDGPGNSTDEARAIALDDSNNVYVTGKSVGSGTYDDYATIKYDTDGNQLWLARYDGPGNVDDEASAIVVDDSNNVYVTGASGEPSCDYATIKYIQTGRLRGDGNGDGEVDIADVMFSINYLFIEGTPPEPFDAGDANCDGVVDIADVMYLINYLFIEGSPPSC